MVVVGSGTSYLVQGGFERCIRLALKCEKIPWASDIPSTQEEENKTHFCTQDHGWKPIALYIFSFISVRRRSFLSCFVVRCVLFWCVALCGGVRYVRLPKKSTCGFV